MTEPPKLALITGASAGIGFETARQLAAQGVRVLLGARDPDKGMASAVVLQSEDLPVEFLHLDVTSETSIAAAVAEVVEKYGYLDILVNNAGVMLDPPGLKVSEVPLSVYRETFETNLFGVIAVTNAFLPLIRKSLSGRIVNVSSILGSITAHCDPKSHVYDTKIPAYCVSKTALNAYTAQLAWELKDTPVKVNAAHPGWVRTNMGGPHAPLTVEEGAATSVKLALLPPDGPTGAFIHGDSTLPW